MIKWKQPTIFPSTGWMLIWWIDGHIGNQPATLAIHNSERGAIEWKLIRATFIHLEMGWNILGLSQFAIQRKEKYRSSSSVLIWILVETLIKIYPRRDLLIHSILPSLMDREWGIVILVSSDLTSSSGSIVSASAAGSSSLMTNPRSSASVHCPDADDEGAKHQPARILRQCRIILTIWWDIVIHSDHQQQRREEDSLHRNWTASYLSFPLSIPSPHWSSRPHW